MATKRTLTKPTTRKQPVRPEELAVSTATAVTNAIARSKKLGAADGKINIHIHVGDVILIGFDEAIDAEEWGMRENNTEIIGGKPAKGRTAQVVDADAEANQNKKISRSIQFRKGALALSALENSEPASPSSSKKRVARKQTAAPARRARSSKTR